MVGLIYMMNPGVKGFKVPRYEEYKLLFHASDGIQGQGQWHV